MKINIKKLSENAIIPTYGSIGAAGADLYALISDSLVVKPGETVLVGTGIAMEIPEGFVGLIFARSGLSTRKGLAPANKVGVIDSDYRGEIKVPLYNQSDSVQTIEKGERIAQMVITPFINADFTEVDELDDTLRGAEGFGSTGRK